MDGFKASVILDEKISINHLIILLENIEQGKSLRKTTLECDISYRYAWDLLKRAENFAKKDLFKREVGGKSGGTTYLTQEGREFLSLIKNMQNTAGIQAEGILNGERVYFPPQKDIIIATSMEPVELGLSDLLSQEFIKMCGCSVFFVPMGSGRAIELAKTGRFDAIITHAPNLEKDFLNEKWGIGTFSFFSSDFILVGAKSDRADIGKERDIVKAFKKIAKSKVSFISRNDNSGTNLHEKFIWKLTNIPYEQSNWYHKLCEGRGNFNLLEETLRLNAYTLVSRVSFQKFNRETQELQIFCEQDELLKNNFNVIPLNAKKIPINQELAVDFAQWLEENKTKKLILSCIDKNISRC